jgi:hypothetical protein
MKQRQKRNGENGENGENRSSARSASVFGSRGGNQAVLHVFDAASGGQSWALQVLTQGKHAVRSIEMMWLAGVGVGIETPHITALLFGHRSRRPRCLHVIIVGTYRSSDAFGKRIVTDNANRVAFGSANPRKTVPNWWQTCSKVLMNPTSLIRPRKCETLLSALFARKREDEPFSCSNRLRRFQKTLLPRRTTFVEYTPGVRCARSR